MQVSKNIPLLTDVVCAYFISRTLKPGTRQEYEWLIQRCFSDWLEREITSITKDEIEERHRYIVHTRGATSGSNAMRLMRALMNYAIYKYEEDGEPVLKVNPVKRMSEIRAWKAWRPKRTYIKPEDLPAWFAHVLRMSHTTLRDLLLLLMFTGLRKSEAAGLHWCNVDLIEGTLTIPETKNGDDLILPLSDFLIMLLSRRRDCAPTTQVHVFPARPHKDAPYDAHVQYQNISKQTGVNFTWHDLRRTFCTVAENIGIPYEVIARLVNHRSPGGITGGYIVRSVQRLRQPMQTITDEIFRLGAVQKPPITHQLPTPALTLVDSLRLAYFNGAATIVDKVAFFSDEAIELATHLPADEAGMILARQGLLYRDSLLCFRSGSDRRYGIAEALLAGI